MSLRDRLLSAVKEKKFKDVDVPGIGKVRVKALRGNEYDKVLDGKTESQRNAILVVATATDPETGEPVFDEDCIELLSRGAIAPLVPLVNAAKTMLYPDEEDAKKSIPAETVTGSV